MIRHFIFNVITAVSLLLFLAAATDWFFESAMLHGWNGEAYRTHRDRMGESHYELQMTGGGIGFNDNWYIFTHDLPEKYQRANIDSWPRHRAFDGRWNSNYDYPGRFFSGQAPKPVLGFAMWSHGVVYKHNWGNDRNWGVIVPCWFVVALTAILPALWSIRRWHRQ